MIQKSRFGHWYIASNLWTRCALGLLAGGVVGVASMTPEVALAQDAKPTAQALSLAVGVYDAVHPHWSDTVIISADGRYKRGSGDPGSWSLSGDTLTLKWDNWGPEPVQKSADGFQNTGGFKLVRRPSPAVGAYQGSHPHWGDTVTIGADGRYSRGNGDPGYWYLDGDTLTLHWDNWGPEVLQKAADGYQNAGGFKLVRKTAAAVITPTPTPEPPTPTPSAANPPEFVGSYDAVHPHWKDTVILEANGRYKRASNGDPGTWSFSGNTLTLKWDNWGPETLERTGKSKNFKNKGGFSMKRR